MRAPALEKLDVESIEVRGERRGTRPDKVDAIAQSMDKIGLQTPISVRYYAERPDFAKPGPTDDALILVAGHHRLLGAKQLGWEKINCFVHYEGDEIDAGLWEIDENLCRSELSEAEEARCLAKRKELWEAREKREAEIQVEQIVPPETGYKKPPPQKKGFAAETAAVTGETKQSVNRKIARATAIDPDVLDAIAGGKWDKGVVLDLLKKLSHAEQRQALFRVKNGASDSFEDAFNFIKGFTPRPVPKPAAPLNDIETRDKWLQAGMSWWNRGSKEWREEFLSRVDTPVMDSKNDDIAIPEFLRRTQ
jgi:hypothetical protein